mmetsp:Transcript_13678/g.22619  ORF Transcript_13678/g.22619 Transcript_13678/m.22619 type:complete len:209 (-) Transcript_13678:985-1611(-)
MTIPAIAPPVKPLLSVGTAVAVGAALITIMSIGKTVGRVDTSMTVVSDGSNSDSVEDIRVENEPSEDALSKLALISSKTLTISSVVALTSICKTTEHTTRISCVATPFSDSACSTESKLRTSFCDRPTVTSSTLTLRPKDLAYAYLTEYCKFKLFRNVLACIWRPNSASIDKEVTVPGSEPSSPVMRSKLMCPLPIMPLPEGPYNWEY